MWYLYVPHQQQWSTHDVGSTTRAGSEDDAPLSCPTKTIIFYYELGCGGVDVAPYVPHRQRWSDVLPTSCAGAEGDAHLSCPVKRVILYYDLQCGVSTMCAGGEDDVPPSCPTKTFILCYEPGCSGAGVVPCAPRQQQ